MPFCFATGSDKIKDVMPALNVLNYLEYLTFDFLNCQIHVTGDFIVQNVSPHIQYLRGLHRGNISFIHSSAEWLNDDYWTKTLLEIGKNQIGLTIKPEGKLSLKRVNGETLRVEVLSDPAELKEWGPQRPDDDSYIYFSTWMSPPIKPMTCCLFRVKGVVEGQTFHKLLSPPASKITISGGKSLLKEIEDDLRFQQLPRQNEFLSKFEEFKNKFYRPVSFYNVFFEGSNREEFHFVNGSTDIRTAKSNMEFNNRLINWYWSDSDFTVRAGAKGPVLVLSCSGNEI